MRKFFYILLLAFITPNIAWAISAQIYTDPTQLPEAFSLSANRYDYRGVDGTGNPILVNIQSNIIVNWDPQAYRQVGTERRYGKLTITNFYYNDALKDVASLVFENQSNLNFQWDAENNKIYFSFTGKYFAKAKEVSPYSNAVGKTSAFALVAKAKGPQSQISSYWQSGVKVDYAYEGGSACECVLDLTTKTITIDHPWGVFMLKDQYGASPSYVLEYFEKSEFIESPLSEIVKNNNVGDEVTVSDDLLAVAFLERLRPNGEKDHVMLAKDFGRFENKDINTLGACDFMTTSGTFANEYDQSNWVELVYKGTDENAFFNLEGKILEGKTVTGTFTDKLNPTITLTQLPTSKAGDEYQKNVYIAPSFCDEYVGSSDYFFVRPKPQEFCKVRWINYDANTNAFYVPSMGQIEGGSETSIANAEDLSGGFIWGNTYLTQGQAVDEQVYDCDAVVNKLSSDAETFNVWIHIINTRNNNALILDNSGFIYSWRDTDHGTVEPHGSWPGTRLNSLNKGWYYISFGSEKPSGIIFNSNGASGKKQTSNITDLVNGDNFYNYYPYGTDTNCYLNLSGNGHILAPSVASSAPRRAQRHDPKVGALSERYVVMPLQLDVESVITSVADVHSQTTVASVRYVDPMGRVSSTPHRGINIVVTRYTDGSIATTKVVK